MSVTIEAQADSLQINGRLTPDTRLIARAALALLIAWGLIMAGLWVLLPWLSAQANTPDSAITSKDMVFRWFLTLGPWVLFLLVALPAMVATRESLTIRGTRVYYTRAMGLFHRYSEEFDLLAMQGLAYIDPYHTVRAPEGVPPNSRQSMLGQLVVWYKDGVFWFGNSLAADEVPTVVQALFEYDAQVRSALGVDGTKGLHDMSVWTCERLKFVTGTELKHSGMAGGWR